MTDRLCLAINAYWAKRGVIANARMVANPNKGQPTEVIASDITDIVPDPMAQKGWEAALDRMARLKRKK